MRISLTRLCGLRLASLTLLIVVPRAASGSDLFVSTTGTGTDCSQTSPCALATAIGKAAGGDAVYLGAGTYVGTGSAVVTLTQGIRLYGGWDGAATGAVTRNRTKYESVLDGENARRVVTITGGHAAVIDGLTIANGNATGLTDGCSGSSNNPAGCGGGVFVFQSAATVSSCIIKDNIAASGGGIDVALTAYGGGIYAAYSSGLVIKGNTISENVGSDSCTAAGGGIYLNACETGAVVEQNTIRDNVATDGPYTGWGGGVALTHGSLELARNGVYGNRASTGASSQGSGIFVWYGSDTLADNTVVGNIEAHAVYLGHFIGTFARNRVVGNPAMAALNFVYGCGAVVSVTNNVIATLGAYGIAIAAPSDDPIVLNLRHNTIVGTGSSTGVNIGANATVHMTNTIVAQHNHGIVDASAGGLTQTRTLFWDNTDDGPRGDQPLDGNPNFVSVLGHDFHIRPGSAAADTGDDAFVDDDFDSGARPSGVAPDIGADEAPPSRFDFGTASSPVATGYAPVTSATAYAAATGYGWVSGNVSSRDRGGADPLKRDLVFSPSATFAVAVPSGLYDVTLICGDAAAAHDQMGIFLEATQVDSLTTARNAFVSKTYRTRVSDGQLTVRIADLGGSDKNAVINALVVQSANLKKLDFGTAGSPVAPAFTRVTGATTYSASLGHGWTSGTIVSRDRGGSNALARDLCSTAAAVFAVDLPDDDYVATTLAGDSLYSHDQMQFAFGSPNVGYLVTLPPNTFAWSSAVSTTSGGKLNVYLTDQGGTDPSVVINALDVAPVDRLLYDFGTGTSPVAAGYTRVTPASAYDPRVGFGWQGSVDARNRTTGSDLTRDFNLTKEATFAVDLPVGRWTLTLTLGDASTAHDQMAVYAEGMLVDTFTTKAGEFATWTYYDIAVNDGQLTLLLKDLGGSDPNVVIAALEIR
jgi:fibronectin type 3 domain-containing protein